MDDALKRKIVKEVTEDLISPLVLARRYHIPVNVVRTTVKDAGFQLPKKYKVTYKKNKPDCVPESEAIDAADVLSVASTARNQTEATKDSQHDDQTPAVQDSTNQAPCSSTHQTQAIQDSTFQAPSSSTHQTQAVQDSTNQASCSSTHHTPAVQDFGFSLDNTKCW